MPLDLILVLGVKCEWHAPEIQLACNGNASGMRVPSQGYSLSYAFCDLSATKNVPTNPESPWKSLLYHAGEEARWQVHILLELE
jgi:hypothetical protein